MSDSSLPANNSVTIGDWLHDAARLLSGSGIETARLDSLVLLGDALQQDKSHILAHLGDSLDADTYCALQDAVQRRSTHLPLAYIRGKAEFYGRGFTITPEVLVPRPESESIITLLLRYARSQTLVSDDRTQIVDVGTGSGALAITAQLALPSAAVYATDIDAACLAAAEQNAQQHSAQVHFAHGNLLEPIARALSSSRHTILLCNLPYVPNGYPINQAASHEPAIALFAGSDGLAAYRMLFDQFRDLQLLPQAIITESLEDQHQTLADLAQHHGYNLDSTDGLAQLFVLARTV